MINFEKFTNYSQEIIFSANTKKDFYKNAEVQPEHIMLAMIEDKGICKDYLEELHLLNQHFINEVVAKIKTYPTLEMVQGGQQIFLSKDTNTLLEIATEEAQKLKDEFIGIECILLAFIKLEGTFIQDLLKKQNIDSNKILNVMKKIRGNKKVDTKNAEENLKNANIGAIKVLTPNDVQGPVTVTTLKAFIEKEHLDVLLVDQYSLLEDLSKAKTTFEKVGNIARDIKKLQVEKSMPIIAVAQMNRSKNEDKSLDSSQIGLSDLIPQYATVLLMLEKEESENELIHDSIFSAITGYFHPKYVLSIVTAIVGSTLPSAIKLSMILIIDPIYPHSASLPPPPCDTYNVLYSLVASYP